MTSEQKPAKRTVTEGCVEEGLQLQKPQGRREREIRRLRWLEQGSRVARGPAGEEGREF